MSQTPCGCRFIKCTDNFDPSLADNLGVWWQVSCGCRLYPCVDEVTSHSPSPASSRESSTAPVAAQSVGPHNTSREPFPDGRQPNLDWLPSSDPVHDHNLTYNDYNVFEPDMVDWRNHHCECGNLLDLDGICLYHRPLYPRQATNFMAAADLVLTGSIRHNPMRHFGPTIRDTHGHLFQNVAEIGPFDASNYLPSESTRTEGIMGSSSLNQPPTDMRLLSGSSAERNSSSGVRNQVESGVSVPETITQTIAREDPNSAFRTFDHSWNSPALHHRQPMRLLGSDLSDRRRLQREVDRTRKQLRQVKKERDDLKVQLRKVTEDSVDKNAAFVHDGFLTNYRSAEVMSELNNPSSDRLNSDDPTRGLPFNRGPVNKCQVSQCRWTRPLKYRTSFASTQDDSLISKSSYCCCTCITNANARTSTFPSSINLEGRRSFPVYNCICCGWCRCREQPECDHNSLSEETEASSFSTIGITGSTTSHTSRTDTRQAWNDPYVSGQYHGNRLSTSSQDYISRSRFMQPRPRALALHCHDYGYGSHIRCPRYGRSLSMWGRRFARARTRSRSLTLPSAMPRSTPCVPEHPHTCSAPSITQPSRAHSATILPTWLMLISYPILAALVAIAAATPAETVEIRRLSGVFIGLVGFLAVSSWLVARDMNRTLAPRK